jgi:hypothetical protein
MKRHRANPGRDSVAAPEVYDRFTAEWQIVDMPGSMESGHAAQVKLGSSKPLHFQDQPVGVDRLRRPGEHPAGERLEPTAL